jgi:hypothetical protein
MAASDLDLSSKLEPDTRLLQLEIKVSNLSFGSERQVAIARERTWLIMHMGQTAAYPVHLPVTDGHTLQDSKTWSMVHR